MARGSGTRGGGGGAALARPPAGRLVGSSGPPPAGAVGGRQARTAAARGERAGGWDVAVPAAPAAPGTGATPLLARLAGGLHRETGAAQDRDGPGSAAGGRRLRPPAI
eukprot:6149295-Pleurochrysis_carterae.AAC.1